MKLFAISDVHVGRRENLEALGAMRSHPGDWLALAGDLGDNEEQLRSALELLLPRFARLIWVPGNHELWARPGSKEPAGVERYQRLVEVCRSYGVLTPEDPYPLWEGDDGPCYLCPLFLLYDYSFGPEGLTPEQAVAWAVETGVLCVDEHLLSPAPYASRQAWCAARCASTEARLAALPPDVPTVLINHFPLRQDHAILPLVPRFSIWCGTRRTEDWHRRFRAKAVVYGHLHIPMTRHLDGVRFEEVSLGYPRQWAHRGGAEDHLRQILPPPA